MMKLKNVGEYSTKDFLQDWDIENLKEEFKKGKPYPHVEIDGFFKEEIIDRLVSEYPPIDDSWHQYYNPIEYKYANDDLEKYPPLIKDIFHFLSSNSFIEILKSITGMELEMDPYLHGAGLHAHPKDGRLHVHLDYEKHPYSGKERRLNLILFLNKEWREEYNGDLQLWEKNMSACGKKIYPSYNKAVLFQTNDVSWHGLPEKIKCPEGMYRKTLAYYWVSQLSTKKHENMYRLKAKYVKRPSDPYDERLDQLYKIRKDRRITKEDMEKIYPSWSPSSD